MNYPRTAPPTGGPIQEPVNHRRSAPPSKRPAPLLCLLLAAVLSALAGVVGSVIVYNGGKDLANSNVKDVINEHPAELGVPSNLSASSLKQFSGPMWDSLIDDRYDTLTARAGFAVFTAVLLLVSVLFARNAAVWARVLLTLSAIVALITHSLVVRDYEPASVTGLSWISIVSALAVLVLCWLPANNRFARARKAAR
ncbi:hypothetical protein ACIHFE_09590 [Streptomyces sp. NPDC052396]|uniref:hypothetical protein n=1 Tax=Streptomyces sp. NPDC052396 TaxID=3365689 RepID=UPI0037D3DAC6